MIALNLNWNANRKRRIRNGKRAIGEFPSFSLSFCHWIECMTFARNKNQCSLIAELVTAQLVTIRKHSYTNTHCICIAIYHFEPKVIISILVFDTLCICLFFICIECSVRFCFFHFSMLLLLLFVSLAI